jgi:predicted transcriptional regulator
MTDQPHGTPYGYVQHVRRGTPKCTPCRRAHADRAAQYEARRYLNRGPLSVPAVGTHRRLQALAAIGWNRAHLAAELKVTKPAVGQWLTRDVVYSSTALRVSELYARLGDTPGASERTRRHAASVGWLPPIAWDEDTIDDPATPPYAGQYDSIDEVAVQRAINGRAVQLTRGEQREAIRLLNTRGESAQRIADLLGVSQRTVVRHRRAAA